MATTATPTTVQGNETQAAEVQRDEQYWFTSGDFVLIAKRKVAFKIYIELLSRESTVIRDLVNQDVPQPEEREMMDNCPVMHLTDDPEDLRIFLSLIYDSWRVRKGNKHKKWSVVKVLITLGDKYHASELYEEGVEMLKQTFPRSIALWDKNKGFKYAPEDAISMAIVTRNLDPDLHAVALYLCCSLPIEKLTAGLRHEGSSLPPTVLRRCLQGRENLQMFWFDGITDLFDILQPGRTCTKAACSQTAQRLHALALPAARKRIQDPSTAYDILKNASWTGLVTLNGFDGEPYELCDQCKKWYNRRSVEIRQDFRHSLEERFGLDDVETDVEI